MAFDAFMKIDGIPGESSDDKHKDWIEIASFAHSMKQPASATASSAGGATGERVDHDTLDIRHLKKVKEIADAYNTATQKKIVVTSGTRTSQSQAEAMYTKMAGGDTLAVYANQTVAQKIKSIYDEGVKANTSKNALIEEIKTEIDNQINQGIYISKHLKQGAIDVRSRDMSNDEKEKFKAAAKDVAGTVILETIPPHFHLQF